VSPYLLGGLDVPMNELKAMYQKIPSMKDNETGWQK